MNARTKLTSLCLSHEMNQRSIQIGKMTLYRLFRNAGTRLYSTESWMKSSRCRLLPTASTRLTQVQCFGTTDHNNNFTDTVKSKFISLVKPDPFKSKNALKYNAVRLYLSCTNALIYNKIHEHANLSNSFATWHRLVSLHIWILMTRLVNEEKPGKTSKKFLINAFHEDVEQKVKDIGDKLEVRVRQDEVDQLNSQFVAALLAYDEGLLMSDRHLAGALWRMLFTQIPDVNPSDLELLVQYIRKNIKLIHSLKREHILANGMVPFLPLHGDSVLPETYDFLEKVSSKRLKAR